MMAPATSFISHFICIAKLSDSHPIEPFARATDPNIFSTVERTTSLTSDPENIFLVSDGKGEVLLVHIALKSWVTLSATGSKIVGLQGLGSSASAFLVDTEEFMTAKTVLVPDINQILACDIVEAIKTLSYATHVTYAKNALPGPLESITIYALEDRSCPSKCIHAIMEKSRALDIDDDADPGNCLVLWLWAVGTGQIS
jgi:hypothetical protein